MAGWAYVAAGDFGMAVCLSVCLSACPGSLDVVGGEGCLVKQGGVM